MNNNFKAMVIICVVSSLLTGCETMNGSYDCPLKGTASCESLHDIDNRINTGEYSLDQKSKTQEEKEILGSGSESSDKSLVKIWFAPREDNNGDFHEGRFVYTRISNYDKQS